MIGGCVQDCREGPNDGWRTNETAHYDDEMDISVTRFRAHCLELIRQVESGGEVVEITRHGKTVARLTPPAASTASHQQPWERLRGSGVLAMEPEDSVLDGRAFDALR